eukprot:1023084-Prymnesium_polylepis.1
MGEDRGSGGESVAPCERGVAATPRCNGAVAPWSLNVGSIGSSGNGRCSIGAGMVQCRFSGVGGRWDAAEGGTARISGGKRARACVCSEERASAPRTAFGAGRVSRLSHSRSRRYTRVCCVREACGVPGWGRA